MPLALDEHLAASPFFRVLGMLVCGVVTLGRAQMEETQRLFTASTRITGAANARRVLEGFRAWSDAVEEQSHRRLVLTRIVLRTQDRAMGRALQAWVQLAASLAIIKHLSEQGLQRHRRLLRAQV